MPETRARRKVRSQDPESGRPPREQTGQVLPAQPEVGTAPDGTAQAPTAAEVEAVAPQALAEPAQAAVAKPEPAEVVTTEEARTEAARTEAARTEAGRTEAGQPPGARPSKPAAPERESALAVIFALLFWGAIGAGVVWSNETSRQFVQDHALPIAVAGGVLLVLGVIFATQARIRRSHAAVRAGLVLAFGVIPAGLLMVLPETAQVYTLRAIFLILVIFTPTVMWWLFVLSQRESLLNEFVANLDRLGLLAASSPAYSRESREARRARVSSYLQKFEANFVRISPGIFEAVVDGKVPRSHRDDSSGRTPLASSAVPVFLTLLLMTIGWLLTLPITARTSATEPLWESALSPNLTPVTAAFLGAYFFSLQMLFRRYVRRDLRGSAYVAVVMRVVLAVVGTWVVTEIAVDAGVNRASWQLLTTGFVIGVFPKVAWQIVRSVFAKFSRPALPAIEAQLPLSELDGLTVWHEARLEEEDIENVPNMATADLVELMVSTRFPPDRLIDWVDQAILLTALGPDQARSPRRRLLHTIDARHRTTRMTLALHGIRSASALTVAYEGACADDARCAGFQRLLGDKGEIVDLMAAMGTNCNLNRVLTWRGLAHT